ncbi:MAG: hypothetical protein JW776_02880 [Candidatus Lokiarchaeota archaeon]|nr:hypothetical protein [Candidatus Lokiarchaeota archaeon]
MGELAIRCRICDVIKGRYLSQEKAIESIFGKLTRVRVVANVIDIIQEDIQNNENLLKYSSDATKISFLIDDGTSQIWITVQKWSTGILSRIKKGDIIQLIGKVKFHSHSSNEIIPIHFKKLGNPNHELYHELELIFHLKKFGKTKIRPSSTPNQTTQETPQITSSSIKDTNFDLSEFNIDLEENSNQDELKEEILRILQQSDKGDGVDVTCLYDHLPVKDAVVDELLDRLVYSSLIQRMGNNRYKLI